MLHIYIYDISSLRVKNRTLSSPSVYIFLFNLYFTVIHVRAHSFNIVLSLFCEQYQIICVWQLCSAAIYRNFKFASMDGITYIIFWAYFLSIDTKQKFSHQFKCVPSLHIVCLYILIYRNIQLSFIYIHIYLQAGCTASAFKVLLSLLSNGCWRESRKLVTQNKFNLLSFLYLTQIILLIPY